jgi:hypothetical protein
LPPACSDSFEKQSKIQADWSDAPAGTVVAIYRNSTGALHRSAQPLRKGRRSTALRAKDCENLILAAEHARCIGKPLNRMLTVHFDAAGIADPVKATGQLLKLMGDWLRCYNTAITAVWVREAGPTKGEHVHILLSIPPNKIGSFNRMQRGWFKKIGAAWKRGVYLSRPIGGSHKAAFSEACTGLYQQALTGVLHYLLKGADAQGRTAHSISKRGAGGELWGKRCGTTENIGRAARSCAGSHLTTIVKSLNPNACHIETSVSCCICVSAQIAIADCSHRGEVGDGRHPKPIRRRAHPGGKYSPAS